MLIMKMWAPAFVLITALVAAMPASAATLGVTYSGVIHTVDAAGAGQFAPNDTFTFDILFDDTAPDTMGAPTIGDYHGVTQYNGSFSNGYSFSSTTGTDRLAVYNGFGVEFLGHDLAAPMVGAYRLQMVSILFDDPAGMLTNGEARPTDLASLLSLSSDARVLLHFLDLGSSSAFGVFGTVTSASAVAQTPIPAALPLFASAIVGLGFFKRRRKALQI
jgi:hypothetical protein